MIIGKTILYYFLGHGTLGIHHIPSSISLVVSELDKVLVVVSAWNLRKFIIFNHLLLICIFCLQLQKTLKNQVVNNYSNELAMGSSQEIFMFL